VTVTRKERLMQQKILAAMREWLQLGMANRFYNHLIS
jgi:hypothetical protein